MSYQYITSYSSPNYTPNSDVVGTWGRPRTIEAIAIHWWGDPNTNPTFEGVVSTLCNPAREASAHFVATGTGRRVACLVDIPDASWATNSANPSTISIECDPRCRDEDYDVVAELIAEIRKDYGDLPLVPHRQFTSTACPGNYDLVRLDREARNKIAGDEFGTSSNPKPVSLPVPNAVKLEKPIALKTRIDASVWDLTTNPNYKAVKVLPKGLDFTAFAQINFNNAVYYLSEYSFGKGLKTGVNAVDVEPVVVEKPIAQPVINPPLAKEEPQTAGTDRIGALESRMSSIETIVKRITDFLSKIFLTFK